MEAPHLQELLLLTTVLHVLKDRQTDRQRHQPLPAETAGWKHPLFFTGGGGAGGGGDSKALREPGVHSGDLNFLVSAFNVSTSNGSRWLHGSICSVRLSASDIQSLFFSLSLFFYSMSIYL